MSLFEELKRRNVIRVVVLYIVVGWLLMQVADVLFPAMELPNWTIRLVFAMLAIGFPAAIIFSWAFEITPEGVKREKDVDRSKSTARFTGRKLEYITIGVVVAAVGFAVVDRMTRSPEMPVPETAAVSEAPAPVETAPDRPESSQTSIAVLPFVNMSNDPDNEFFSDGISEELLNVLVRIEGLRVPSRTSSFAFKGKDMDIQDIAQELEVDHVLEGSVRKAGNRVRITAQLIDVGTDSHLWSDTYDRELEDIFAVQDEIANAIVAALQTTLGAGETPVVQESRITDDLQAYELYLQGRYFVRHRDYDNLVRAGELLVRATELDPGFSQAWSALAVAYLMQPAYALPGKDPVDLSAHDRAQAAAETALELNPRLAEAQAVLATLYGRAPDERMKALAAHEKSVELDPQDSTAQLWYGIALFEDGYLQDALEVLSAAHRLDPASAVHSDWMSRIHAALGNWEAMEHYASQSMAMGRPYAEIYRGDYALMRGDYDAYVDITTAAVEKSHPLMHEDLPEMARMIAAARKDPALLPRAIEAAENFKGWKSGVYENLQLPEAFLTEIARDVAEGDSSVYSLLWLPWSAFARQDIAFQDFVERHGFLDVWRERGWPDLCRPVDDSFECD